MIQENKRAQEILGICRAQHTKHGARKPKEPDLNSVLFALCLVVILATFCIVSFVSAYRHNGGKPTVIAPVDFHVTELSKDIESLTQEISERYEVTTRKVLTVHEQTAQKMATASADDVACVLNTELGIYKSGLR